MNNQTYVALLLSQQIIFEANVSKNRACISGWLTERLTKFSQEGEENTHWILNYIEQLLFAFGILFF